MMSHGSFRKKFLVSASFPKGNNLGFRFVAPADSVSHNHYSVILKRLFHHNLFIKLSLFSILGFFFFTLLPVNIDSFLDSSGGYSLFLGSVHSASHATDIVCLGDSLTLGVGASPGHDYPSLIAKALGIKVINAGVDGDRTESALKRLETDVLAKDPRMVIMLLGGNDYLDEVPRKKTLENLDEIIRRIQARDIMVVFVEVGSSFFGDSLQKEYNRIAIARRVAVVPNLLRSYFFNPALKNDALHPNDKGYEIIAERILQVVKPILKQES